MGRWNLTVEAAGFVQTRRPIKFQSMIGRYDRQNGIKNEAPGSWKA